MASESPLLKVLEQLPRIVARRVIWAGDEPIVGPTRVRRVASRLHPLGMHRHGNPEICVALRGTSVLAIGTGAWLMRPGAIAVVPPGVMHCEGYYRRGAGYQSLWFGTHGEGLSGGALEYANEFGWRLTHRCWLPDAGAIEEFLADPQSLLRPDRLERLRDQLMVVLSRLHLEWEEFAMSPAASSQWSARPGPPQDSPTKLASRARAMIVGRLDRQLGVGEIAQLLRVSPSYLQRSFRRANGETIQWFMRRTRMEAALQLLRDTDLLAKQVANRVGYSDPLYFSRLFRRYFGVTPSQVKRHGQI